MLNDQPHKDSGSRCISDFFVLRTPMLPATELDAWGDGMQLAELCAKEADYNSLKDAWRHDVDLARKRLLNATSRPEVLHAIYIASPSLHGALEHWQQNPESKKGLQVERALARYFSRMTGRATPFGLFSGISTAKVTHDENKYTHFELTSRSDYKPVSRLDFDYLFALTKSLNVVPGVREELRYWPNSSLYRIGERLHYVESRGIAQKRSHHAVSLEIDEFLLAVLTRAQKGAAIQDLIDCLILIGDGQNDFDHVTEAEARKYVNDLIASEVLVSSLAPAVTGDPLDDLINQLDGVSRLSEARSVLFKIRSRLSALDRHGVGIAPSRYEDIETDLSTLPAPLDRAKLFQVDMVKPLASSFLSATILTELQQGARLLYLLTNKDEPEPLRAFREAFINRYDRACVPLLEALDEEVGIGFGTGLRDGTTLLKGLQFKGATLPEERTQDAPLLRNHQMLLRKLVEAARNGSAEIEIELTDLDTSPHNIELPQSFAVNATLLATSRKVIADSKFEIYLREVIAPGGARFFGRFCHTTPDLADSVLNFIRNESLQEPDAIQAEIVHLPEGRIGNVLCRPVLRDYELVYLGRSGAKYNQQLQASDVLIQIDNGNIKLYSRRLGKRILPHLTNAHGFLNPNLSPVYRFLCYLQFQHGMSGVLFGWGPLHNLDYLPRVRAGNIILSAATWRLSSEEVATISVGDRFASFIAVQNLRKLRGFPRWLLFEQADNSLPVDLDNPISVDAFLHALRRGGPVVLKELLSRGNKLCVSGPEGLFHHEINVPFLKEKPSETVFNDVPSQATNKPQVVLTSREFRTIIPGSNCLFLKVYAGPATLDEILIKNIAPIVKEGITSGAINSWFFIRYSDPHLHLRLRFFGPHTRLRQEVLEMLSESFRPAVNSGRVANVQIDTYEREIERYGGAEGMLISEEIFCADSESVLSIISTLTEDTSKDLRWQAAVIGLDAILNDLGFDVDSKRALLLAVRQNDPLKRAMGEKYRTHRTLLESLINTSSATNDYISFARNAFQVRSNRIKPVIAKLKSLGAAGKLSASIKSLTYSYLHMHVNRIMRSQPNQHEIVLYDFMYRLYDSLIARTKTISLSDKT